MINITIPKKIIETLLKTDNNIYKHLENLHELMFNWLYYYSDGQNKDVKFSYRETYESMGELLKLLNPFENILNTDFGNRDFS